MASELPRDAMMQLTAEVPIDTSTRMYWIGTRYRTGIDESLVSYYTSVFRGHFMKTLSEWKLDGIVFGGHVRRGLFAKHQMNKVFSHGDDPIASSYLNSHDNDLLPPVHVDSSCFVDQHSDLDIYFRKQESIMKFIFHLEQIYSVDYKEKQNHYTGCRVTQVRLRQKVSLMNMNIYLSLDLVTKQTPDIALFPDFDVNGLQINRNHDIEVCSQLTPLVLKRRNDSDFGRHLNKIQDMADILQNIKQRQARLIACSFDFYRRNMVSHFEALSDIKPCIWLPESKESDESGYDFAGESDGGEESDGGDLETSCYPDSRLSEDRIRQMYSSYILRLFGGRLKKMLESGWKIVNLKLDSFTVGVLQLKCGHGWSGYSPQYCFKTNVVMIRCRKCNLFSKLFDDFVS
jgi:hypothetical protein